MTKQNKNIKGFTRALFFSNLNSRGSKIVAPNKAISKIQPLKNSAGFTLIELLVVIAIIALLASIVLVSLQSARQKGRDAKRLGDVTELSTALELYFNTNKGYPSSEADLIPGYAASLPASPEPPDGTCGQVSYPVGGGTGENYEYYPSPTGGSYVLDGLTLYPAYTLFFCLGNQTGNFSAGMHQVTSTSVH